MRSRNTNPGNPLRGGIDRGRTETGLARDEVFDVLSNSRRCHVIRYLQRTDAEAIELREVVDYVTRRECGTTDVDYADRKSVYTALRQTHLPKLDRLGVIEYDPARGEVRRTDASERVRRYLEYAPGDDVPWHVHYASPTAAGAILLVANWIGLHPFAVGWPAFAAIVFAMFSAAAAAHVTCARRRESGRTGRGPTPE